MDFSSDRKQRKIVALEITPLVDVVFLLLIFFLLTATYVKNPTLDIALPKASVNQVTSQKKNISIAIKKNGDIHYDNREISEQKLEGILMAEFAQDEKAVVIIRADKEAMHGKVVEVMDMAKRIGFQKLAIAIQTQSAPPE